MFVYNGVSVGLKVLNNTFSWGNPYCRRTQVFTDAGMVDFELKNNVSENPVDEFFWAWDLETLTNVSVTNNVGRGEHVRERRVLQRAPRPRPRGVSQSANQWNTDPKLVDAQAPLTGGFQLQSTSPAINTGANLSSLGVTRRLRRRRAARRAGLRRRRVRVRRHALRRPRHRLRRRLRLRLHLRLRRHRHRHRRHRRARARPC